MYIQRNKSRYKSGKEYVTPLLCSKYLENGKIKTRVLANLSSYTEEQVPDFINATPYKFFQNFSSYSEAIERCFLVRSMVLVIVSLLTGSLILRVVSRFGNV